MFRKSFQIQLSNNNYDDEIHFEESLTIQQEPGTEGDYYSISSPV